MSCQNRVQLRRQQILFQQPKHKQLGLMNNQMLRTALVIMATFQMVQITHGRRHQILLHQVTSQVL